MALLKEETLVAGTIHFYVGTHETATPPDALPALPYSVSTRLAQVNTGGGDYAHLGYTDREGAKFGVSTEIQKLYAHQSLLPLRVIPTETAARLEFPLLQFNTDTFRSAFGGGTFEALGGGGAIYTPPPVGTLREVVAFADVIDGTRVDTVVIQRGYVAGSVEATFQRNDWSKLPLVIDALAVDGEEDTQWQWLSSKLTADGS